MEGLCHVFIFGLLVAGSAASKMFHGTATWYDDPNGDGSDGGACGYQKMIHAKGYKAHETAVSDVLFRNGQGCGGCYKVMCYDFSLCSKKPVTVVAMDQSPGGSYPHFDLSGSAFGQLAVNGRANDLRNKGNINIVWKGTPCKYRKKKISFHVMTGSTSDWLSLLVEYENGVGDVESMQIKGASTGWEPMRHVWGATWCAQATGAPLQGPFSINLTNSYEQSLVMNNVIPRSWKIEATYTSHANFN